MLNNNDLPKKEIDLDSLVFLERYVTNLLKLELLTFFGNNPHLQSGALDVATQLGRSYKSVRSELGDLTILGLLQKSVESGQPVYQLTADTNLRPKIMAFAKNRALVAINV